MLFKSTRGSETVGAAKAIAQGIATDSGLFVPTKFPQVTKEDLLKIKDYSYNQMASFILNKYLGEDYTVDEIKSAVDKAYSKEAFAGSPVVLNAVDKNKAIDVLELWHGPTFAFKDMALQLLPHLLTQAVGKIGETKQVVILVATSGDTGKAALEGFADVDGTKIVVFYPEDGVSKIQKMQMITQKGNNVSVIAVKGNFDDAQTGVKKIFNDKMLAEKMAASGYVFSSANSINWGRLVPQIIYYFYAYTCALKNGSIKLGDQINFVVPTGNFGNILAGFYAKCMGLPVGKFICASNANNVLTDFINTGCYDRRRDFHKTNSPSMDILVSSNLERLLYHLTDGNTQKIADWMNQLSEKGFYDIDSDVKNRLQDLFYASWVDDESTKDTIAKVFSQNKYLLDTHTSVAWLACERYKKETGDKNHSVVVSTASPFKFAPAVLKALKPEIIEDEVDAFEALNELSEIAGLEIPIAMKELSKQSVVYDKTVSVDCMESAVEKFLNI